MSKSKIFWGILSIFFLCMSVIAFTKNNYSSLLQAFYIMSFLLSNKLMPKLNKGNYSIITMELILIILESLFLLFGKQRVTLETTKIICYLGIIAYTLVIGFKAYKIKEERKQESC